jgi:hypothetical protein
MKRSPITSLLLPASLALGLVSAVLLGVDRQSADRPDAAPATASGSTAITHDEVHLCLSRTSDEGVRFELDDDACTNHALADTRGTLTVTAARDGDVVVLTGSDP